MADAAACKHEYGIRPLRSLKRNGYDAAILAVAHKEFRQLGLPSIRRLCRKNSVVYDIKHLFKPHETDGRL